MNYIAEDAFCLLYGNSRRGSWKEKIKQQLVAIVVDRLLFAIH
jgi:hypothetical protein